MAAEPLCNLPGPHESHNWFRLHRGSLSQHFDEERSRSRLGRGSTGSARGRFARRTLVTGWTYRYFARHLQESLNDRLTVRAKAGEVDGRLPVFYAFIFDASGVYGAPLTPALDEKALVGENLEAKTAAGPVQSGITIEDRAFGYAAVRTPRLGADLGIVVLRSET